MVLNVKTRLVLAGAVLGASLLGLASANAQIEPSTGAPVSPTPGVPQTSPDLTPQPLPDYSSMDGGLGGSGLTPLTPLPSLMGQDAGLGGSGFVPLPSPFDNLDAGLR